MPHSLTVNKDDIERVETQLNRKFSDDERRVVLERMTSVDIQAGPGCGKTTLLVAKLAILASKWRWRDRGICVLSHTNVARTQVETYVTKHPHTYRLLYYPHFIGTFQGFVDEFLALPYLRDAGVQTSAVDNDRLLRRLRGRLSRTTSYAIEKRYPDSQKRDSSFLALRIGEDLDAGEARVSGINFKENTDSYKQLREAKLSAVDEGVFGFEEMYDFAKVRLSRNPSLVNAFQYRFPWVFLDELQDCGQIQLDLVSQLFSEKCIVQRFGDPDQAIFEGEAPLKRPDTSDEDMLRVTASLRFRQSLASLARTLSITGNQLIGSASSDRVRDNGAHTIFLFTPTSIQHVLPSYAELLLEEYPEESISRQVFKAVAARHRGCDPNKIPYGIEDYWPPYQSEFSNLVKYPDTFIEYVRDAQRLRYDTGELKTGFDQLMRGISDYLYTYEVRSDSGRRMSPYDLCDRLSNTTKTNLLSVTAFRRLLRDLLMQDDHTNRATWEAVASTIPEVVKGVFDHAPNVDTERFLRWDDSFRPPTCVSTALPRNVFEHSANGRSVKVGLGSIHSVKGETHTATLLLETCVHEHDLEILLPYLCGVELRLPKEDTRKAAHMRKAFVAMSRPSELLCLAIHADHVPMEDRELLKDRGWKIMQV